MTDELSDYREYKLSNGLVVALKNTSTKTIASKFRMNYSSFHEKIGEEGFAHFLEHCLVTAGSGKYNPNETEDMRNSFGKFDAYTALGRVCFESKMLSEDFEKWLDFVSQHAFFPRFDEEKVNGERGRVLREISDQKSNPSYLANREFNNLFYNDHPLSRIILGNENTIGNVEIDKLKKFHSRGFYPNNADLIFVGAIPKDYENLIQKYFGNISSGENMRVTFPDLSPLLKKIIVHRSANQYLNVENPAESSAQISMMFNGPKISNPDTYALGSLIDILNVRLFRNLGQKKGLAYSSHAFYGQNYQAVSLGINASVPSKKLEESISAIFEEINILKKDKVEEKDLQRIKRDAKYRITQRLDSNQGYLALIESALDKDPSSETVLEGYEAVTPSMVLEVANKYLPDRSDGKYLLYIQDPLLEQSKI